MVIFVVKKKFPKRQKLRLPRFGVMCTEKVIDYRFEVIIAVKLRSSFSFFQITKVKSPRHCKLLEFMDTLPGHLTKCSSLPKNTQEGLAELKSKATAAPTAVPSDFSFLSFQNRKWKYQGKFNLEGLWAYLPGIKQSSQMRSRANRKSSRC